MKTLLLILLLYLLVPVYAYPQDEINPWLDLPHIGFITKNATHEYLLTAELGIEQWEDSKRSERIHQIWYLRCAYPPYFGPKDETHCSLERTMIVRWDMPGVKTGIHVHNHTTDNGTLQLTTVDWKNGKLHFTIIYVDGTSTEVMMQLMYVDNSIFLQSFKALGISKSWFEDSMVAIEYKVPEYGYTLSFPIEFRGFKEESRKHLDDLISSFSEADRRVWKALRGDSGLFEFPNEQQLRSMFARYDEIEKGEREPTTVEWEKFIDFIVARLHDRLTDAGMSVEAREKLIDVMKDEFLAEQVLPLRKGRVKGKHP